MRKHLSKSHERELETLSSQIRQEDEFLKSKLDSLRQRWNEDFNDDSQRSSETEKSIRHNT